MMIINKFPPASGAAPAVRRAGATFCASPGVHFALARHEFCNFRLIDERNGGRRARRPALAPAKSFALSRAPQLV